MVKQTIIRLDPRVEVTKTGRERLVYRRIITSSDSPNYPAELERMKQSQARQVLK